MRIFALAGLVVAVAGVAGDAPDAGFTVALRLDSATGESHVAVTCDGRTAHMYVDGEPLRSWDPGPAAADPTSVLWDAATAEPGDARLLGMSLYDRLLTEAEIRTVSECPPAAQTDVLRCDAVDLCACDPVMEPESPEPAAPPPE